MMLMMTFTNTLQAILLESQLLVENNMMRAFATKHIYTKKKKLEFMCNLPNFSLYLFRKNAFPKEEKLKDEHGTFV